MMFNVLVTDDVHPFLLEKMNEHKNIKVYYRPKISWTEALAIIDQYEGIIVNSKMICNKEFLSKAKNLKFIARLGSGLDIIDLPFAKEKNIKVYSAPGGNANAVAEHAMGMLLSLANHLNRSHQQVSNLVWNREQNRGFELQGKTIGIIGFGNNGSALGSKLSGWGMKVLAYDKYKTNYLKDYPHIEESSQEEILEKADIISLHVQLTEETHHLVNEDFLSKCKQDCIIINTSRGKNIDTPALLKYLKNGKIKAAALDVFENEKTNTYTKEEIEMYSELLSLPNVIGSPHVAGWTVESKLKIAEIIWEQIEP